VRLHHTRSVRKYDLVIFIINDPDDPLPGSLCLMGYNRDILPGEGIDQGRFSDVGLPDDIDEAGLVQH